jgi:hypothetical protein
VFTYPYKEREWKGYYEYFFDCDPNIDEDCVCSAENVILDSVDEIEVTFASTDVIFDSGASNSFIPQ